MLLDTNLYYFDDTYLYTWHFQALLTLVLSVHYPHSLQTNPVLLDTNLYYFDDTYLYT